MDAIEDVDVTTVAPLRVLPADIGAENVPGAADQGALALADKEMEGVAYKVIESDNDDDDLPVLRHYESDDDDSDDADGDNDEAEATEAPRYNLRQQQPPTFESYDNTNGIDDVDLDLESSSFDVSIELDDTPEQLNSFYQCADPGPINLAQVPVMESPREQPFEKSDKPRKMSYQFMVAQMMEH